MRNFTKTCTNFYKHSPIEKRILNPSSYQLFWVVFGIEIMEYLNFTNNFITIFFIKNGVIENNPSQKNFKGEPLSSENPDLTETKFLHLWYRVKNREEPIPVIIF
jgi:D-lyxose ketol-isomerase